MNQVQEIEDVRAAVQRYVDAVRVGDHKLLAECFLPEASMYGYLNGGATNVPISAFLEMAKGFTAPSESGEDYRAVVATVQVSGSAAVAALHESSYLGMDFVDFFSLILTSDGWRIASKTYHQLGAGQC